MVRDGCECCVAVPCRLRSGLRGLGVRLKHIDLTVRAAREKLLVSRPAHALDDVLMRLCLPLLLPAGQVPYFYNTVTTATCEMLKRVRVLGKRVYMRSILVALSARVYSRARSKGCWVGSRLRVTFATLDPGACAEEADRLRALIFILRSFDVAICSCAGSRELLQDAQKFERQVGLANGSSGASVASARRGSLPLFAVCGPRTCQFSV
jgi:hypothetical protein